MATKKETTEVIRAFKEDKSSVWYCMKHWRVMDGELILAAGGLDIIEEREHVYKYFKNKKLL